MLRSRVPLVVFYSALLPAAAAAGYKIIVTALVREADSPAFFEDIKRYWSSLHDVTGPHILFVFAGADAAKKFNEWGIHDGYKPIVYYSQHMAVGGESLRITLRRALSTWHHEYFRYGDPLLEEEDLAREHTLELYNLRCFLG